MKMFALSPFTSDCALPSAAKHLDSALPFVTHLQEPALNLLDRIFHDALEVKSSRT
jgi:hypothetical protein